MTRNAAPVGPPVVCTVAGSDSGGGAGIQADLKAIEAGGGFGTSVITSVTAQNTTGVESTHVLPVAEIEAQAEAVFGDFEVGAVKTGMLAVEPVVDLVADRVADHPAPAVVDPVMVAASGDRLLEPEAEDAYGDLIAEATLVTPNADEAEVLTGVEVDGPEAAEEAAAAVVDMGAEAALVKGGHVPGEEVVDVLVTAETVETIRHERVDTDATHGSGCTLSSAIATRLAHGDDLPAAVEAGVDLLARAVRYNVDVGEGPGSVHHLVALRDRAARQPTEERVAAAVREFVDRDVARLVPEVGMNVVGATPYAELPAECAAVEGRVVRTLDGAAATRGVRLGASTNVARFLLAAREGDADLRFAVNCRYDEGVAGVLGAVGPEVVEVDVERGTEDETAALAREAMGAGEPPAAVVDTGGAGREPMTYLLAEGAVGLVDRVLTLREALAEREGEQGE